MTYAKNVVDINKEIEKAFAEQYPAGWTEEEMRAVIEEKEALGEYEPPTPSDTQDYQDNYGSKVL